MRRVLTFIGLVLLVAGAFWWRARSAHPAPVQASIYETDLIEAVVREMLGELPPPVPPVCFLAFGAGSTPPSRAFLARFHGSHPQVRSCAGSVAPPGQQYFETATGKPGLMLHVIEFQEVIPRSYDVWIGFSHLPAGPNRFVYRLNRVGDRWVVTKRKRS